MDGYPVTALAPLPCCPEIQGRGKGKGSVGMKGGGDGDGDEMAIMA